ncbi:LytR/AlgR family response regulator transcription factor [Roseateles saccharophilus]|uniref:LytTR family two component transcriptional regulator n=1 Tax=Roseateles saccharophilus TaxID=304 RepID=A0A4R3UK85_ROSSA|nr:LytTR family DNA-binding domain-containing protein [Roseateles saccharophilus]MDG0834596.1 response regulator transcription factor [Roseateles saccharophilus]TCU89045.1 LytTR family two component transcriptional regulator [Roseateles saccharophilus]
MSTTTVLIAEDEPLAAEALADWVKATPGLQLVAVCEDGEEALAQIRALKPALVLTDIQMPGLTGLQVVQVLQGDAHQPRIIFTTAYDQHALTAFELHAVDYLLKPFSRERFDEAVAHALRDAAPSNSEVAQALGTPADAPLTRLLVRDQGKIFPLQVDAIECLRSDNKYTAITSKGRSFLVRLPIADFETRLDPARFLRVQRGCIVNLDFVDSMTPDENSQLVVQLRDGSRITANREVSKMLREQSL